MGVKKCATLLLYHRLRAGFESQTEHRVYSHGKELPIAKGMLPVAMGRIANSQEYVANSQGKHALHGVKKHFCFC